MVADQYAGQSGPCASCGESITIPAGAGQPVVGPAMAGEPDQTMPMPRQRSSRSSLWIVVLVIVLVCAVPFGGILLQAVQVAFKMVFSLT